MNQPTGHRLRKVIRLISLALAVAMLAACSWMNPQDKPSPSPTSREPTAADVESMRQQLAGIDGVTRVEIEYFKGTFGTAPSTEATLHTDATEKPELIRILDTAYRITWGHPDVTMGVLSYLVTNPAGLTAAGDDLGFPKDASPADLYERYGPPGTPAPSPTG